jgi:hypothetical protein
MDINCLGVSSTVPAHDRKIKREELLVESKMSFFKPRILEQMSFKFLLILKM